VTEHTTDTRSIKIALAVSLTLVILQAVSYLLTNIQSQLASALDSTSDVLISTFLLLSVLRSRKPADEFHMFGHGRAQNVAALVSSTILIFLLSFGAFQAAIPKLFQTTPSEFQNTNLAIGVTVIAILAYAIPLVDIFRTKIKGAAVKAQIVALLEMEVAFIAVLVGVILVGQGYQLADPLVSMFVASVIAISGIYLLKDNINYLIGRSPGKEFMEKVETTAKSVMGVLGVHDLKAEFVGPSMVQASLHIEVIRGTPIETADRIAHEVEERVSKEVNCQYCTIHVDPSNQNLPA
jgi:cation diffusion facilitator family transporter